MNQAQLETTRTRLLEKRDQVAETIRHTDEERIEQLRPAGEISDVRTHPADQDTEGLTEQLVEIEMLRDELRSIDGALARLEDGSYGACQNCGKQVSAERLEAIPFTPYCMRCEQAFERREAIR